MSFQCPNHNIQQSSAPATTPTPVSQNAISRRFYQPTNARLQKHLGLSVFLKCTYSGINAGRESDIKATKLRNQPLLHVHGGIVTTPPNHPVPELSVNLLPPAGTTLSWRRWLSVRSVVTFRVLPNPRGI
ncbi:hypothetical protein VTI28DRAFT_6758 [Corynascus sepedonium]